MEGMEGRRRLLTGMAGAGQSSPRAAPPLSRRPQEAPRGLSEEAQGAQEPYTPMGNQANQPKSQIDLKGSSHIRIYQITNYKHSFPWPGKTIPKTS